MHQRGRSSASASREELGLQRGRSTGEELSVGVSVGVDSGEARRGGRNLSSMREELGVSVEGGARCSTMSVGVSVGVDSGEARRGGRNSSSMREELGGLKIIQYYLGL
ncbi:uncharacterized protein A4U43_C06F7610 [Asparagus officinalis]|uniref:Uncharacterized protein n=1 Tax=Asparagus officinalis TaxID=4686 RepID=A0A5P1EKB3_ASPOF|nr:uncharacterized protein A4U43_C06F7610 [Asparagus officinalis]